MFDIGATELLVIAIVAIVVVGPRELPRLLRTVGNMMSKAKGLAREFQDQFDEAAKDAGVDEIRKDFDDMTNLDMDDGFGDAFDPIKNAGEELKDAVEAPVDQAAKADKAAADKPAAKKPTARKTAARKAAKPKAKAAKTKTEPKDGAKTAPSQSQAT